MWWWWWWWVGACEWVMSRELLYGLLLVSDGGRWGPDGAVLSVHVWFQLYFSQGTALGVPKQADQTLLLQFSFSQRWEINNRGPNVHLMRRTKTVT